VTGVLAETGVGWVSDAMIRISILPLRKAFLSWRCEALNGEISERRAIWEKVFSEGD
jgi:hypothetical protein